MLGGAEFAGVVADGISEEQFVNELCSGLTFAILEEQAIGNYIFVPQCKVLVQESENDDDDGRIVVFNSLKSAKAYRVDNFDIDKLTMKDILKL